MAGFYLIWILRATWVYSTIDQSIQGDVWRLVFSNVVKFVLWVLPAAAYIIWCKQQPVLESLKVNTALDKQGLVWATAVSTLYFVIILSVEFFASQRTLAPLSSSSAWAITGTLLSILFSPIIEELFFRGFVLNELETRFGFWKGNLLQALLFVLVHWPNWVWTNGLQQQTLATSGGIFTLATLLGWAAKRTISIWPPVVIHTLNNFIAAFVG
jgi:membrane protease YdiL (CAAX protease family)